MYILKNERFCAKISEIGAELQSINDGKTEYLWQGDPAYWGRRSPILFPIVGSVWNAEFRVDGKTFNMGQHGFARDMVFQVLEQTDTEASFRLESSEKTLSLFPYPFILDIKYVLEGNRLDVIWKVTNPSEENIYFQIGAHPAFYYPDYNPSTTDRGYLSFGKKGDLHSTALKEKGCVDAGKTFKIEIPENGLLPITSETFDDIDTILLENSQIDTIAMLRSDKSPWLTMTFDAPVVGIWSPPHKDAPFICLEPWYGRCDRAEFSGEFKDKDWTNALKPGQAFETKYSVTFE